MIYVTAMITEKEFIELIRNPESTTLDFKREQYCLQNNSSNKTNEFIKDIICFANTIREKTAYILIGISSNGDLLGIDDKTDDAIFQQKIKDKVYPKPHFLYYTFDYDNKLFGIIEIPVFKYPEPIVPVVKMKSLEVGRVYFRRGSSNSEAIGREIIFINKWLENLPAQHQSSSVIEEISSLLSKTTARESLLSNCISEGLAIANKYKLNTLHKFCDGELQGWAKYPKELEGEFLDYRSKDFILSPANVNLEIPRFYNSNAIQLYNEIRKMNLFNERTIVFTEPISEIENALSKLVENKGNMLYVKDINSIYIEADGSKTTSAFKMYAISDNFERLYNSIKQRFIEILISMQSS